MTKEFIIKDGVLIKYKGNSKTISLPKDVKEIGDFAFYISFSSFLHNKYDLHNEHKCMIEEIDLSGITKIGKSAFAGQKQLKNIFFDDALQTIGERAFSGCIALKNVVFPETLTLIEKRAFEHCESLTDITLPDSLNYLGLEAISNCKSLEYVSIGKKLYKQIAFYSCNRIKRYDVSKANKRFKSINGNIYSIDGKTLQCYAFGKTTDYIINESCEIINFSDFFGDKIINRFIVNENNSYFSTIDDNLYDKNRKTLISYCSGKTDKSYTVPDYIKYIHPLAFCFNKSLEKIIITNNITTPNIEDRKTVTLGTNITEIEIFETVTDISWMELHMTIMQKYDRKLQDKVTTFIFHGDKNQWEKVKKFNGYDSEFFKKEILFLKISI